MDSVELENFKFQLTQVEKTLELDSGNKELIALKQSLLDIISLSTQLPNSSSGTTNRTLSAPKPKLTDKNIPLDSQPLSKAPAFEIGDIVEAKYSGDGKYYEGRIEAISNANERIQYSVLFTQYGNQEFVKPYDIKLSTSTQPMKKRPPPPPPSQHQPIDPKLLEKKLKKKRTREEQKEKKEKEHSDRQSAWQSFNKKLKK